jgi:outer membrane protein TolC
LLGFGGSNPADVIDSGNLSALLLPRINWTFLDFGRVNARVDQVRAGASEAEANYDKVELAALSEAEQALTRFGGQRSRVLGLAKAQKSSENSEVLTLARLRRGTASRITEIDATLQRLQSEKAQLVATTYMTKSYVVFQKSLALGWTDVVGKKQQYTRC